MAIDAYFVIGSGRKKAFSIDESLFFLLELTLAPLQKATGLTVDPYGTTVLSPEHASIWKKSILAEKQISQSEQMLSLFEDVLQGLELSISTRQPLVIEGD